MELDEDIPKRFEGRRVQVYIRRGWIPMVNQLNKELAILDPNYTIGQIKEKFGGLRYYIDTGTEEMHKLIEEAEDASFLTCELCGKEGKLQNNNGWYHTTCPNHTKE